MSFSNYYRNSLINQLFRGTAYTFPGTLYFALLTATPTAADTGATISEVSGGNYARQAVTSNTGDWGAASAGSTSNTNAITWSAASSWTGLPVTVTSIAILDSATLGAGNVLLWQNLTASKTIASGDVFSFSAGNVSDQLT